MSDDAVVVLIACLGLLLAGCSDDDPAPAAAPAATGTSSSATGGTTRSRTRPPTTRCPRPRAGLVHHRAADGLIAQLDAGVRVLLIDTWYGQSTDRRGMVATADESREEALAAGEGGLRRPARSKPRCGSAGAAWRGPGASGRTCATGCASSARPTWQPEPARHEGLAGRASARGGHAVRAGRGQPGRHRGGVRGGRAEAVRLHPADRRPWPTLGR